ncbi:hypothetical protein ACA910_003171 [Epithemia clementina (nom. ined.)]
MPINKQVLAIYVTLAFSLRKSGAFAIATKQQQISAISATALGWSKPKPADSLEAFEDDVKTVLHELRPNQYDPTVPSWFSSRQLSFTSYWGLEEWKKHSSRRRHFRYIIGLPKSRLLHRCMPQLGALLLWTIVALWFSHIRPTTTGRLRVPLTSLSLVSTFVAALQTLRSNQGLSRLKDARNAMGRMVLYTRDIALLVATYIAPRDPRLGLLAARHLALFGWAVKSHLREVDSDDIVHCLLSRKDAEFMCGQRKKPIAVLHRLRQIMENMSSRLLIGTTEHRLIEENLKQLNSVVMEAERIRATPIPPVYAAHAGRLMIVYLATLPFALLGAELNALTTLALTLIVGFAMLGLDEMSHLFEQPFRFMPLYQLAKVSTLDVADAFCCPLPSLEESDDTFISKVPSYWATDDMKTSLPYDGRKVNKRHTPIRSELGDREQTTLDTGS